MWFLGRIQDIQDSGFRIFRIQDSRFTIQRSTIVISTLRGESSFFGLRSKVFLQDSGFTIHLPPHHSLPP
jgi:hypothetical protein